jgi:hypothetical protein
MGAVSTALPRLHVRMCIYIWTGNCITDLHITLENSVEAILHSSFDAAHLYLQYQSIIFLQCLAIQSSSVGSVCLSSCLKLSSPESSAHNLCLYTNL